MDDKILINSPANSAQPPPLLRLSDELLDSIFVIAYASGGPCANTRKPICRRLLPFQRAQLYRHVRLHSYQALKKFHRTIMGSSSIAGLVRHLHFLGWKENVVRADGSSRRRSGRGGDEDGDRKLVTPIDFAVLVPRLVRLQTFGTQLLDPARLDVVFLDQPSSRRLEALKKLEFSQDHNPLVQSGCDVGARLQWLACLPRLADLTLVQPYGADPILPDLPVPPPSLASRVSSSSRAGSTIGGGRVLRSTEWRRTLDERHDEEEVRAPINSVLALFKNLEELFVCRCAFDMSLPTSLADLVVLDKLVHLSFHDDGIVPDAFLLGLLANPSHLPNLKTLELNHVTSSLGDTVEKMGGALPAFETRDDYPHWPMWEGWSEPEYPEGSTEQGLRRVLVAALERNVVVKGDVYDALHWYDAFEAEERIALLALGDLTGNYARARPVLGAEAVNAHILARARATVEGGEDGKNGEA
ncbi:hypothetical protein JCM9279_002666 [Rhodotorula babjevae]